jgi:N-acetylglucosamine PTS system EIICBA or EIICB component
VTACTTRLRLIVGTQETVDVQALKRLGARGVVKPSATALQVVVGPIADQIAGEIREAMASMPKDSPPAAVLRSVSAPQPVEASPSAAASAPAPAKDVLRGLLAALGGRQNVRNIEPASSRLRIAVANTSAVDSAAIRGLGMRGVAIAAPDCVHVIVGPAAEAAGVSLRELLAS